ncbi:MAG: cytochrome P450 [Acidobacteria bacterium]|nr:cytochrome P450 [Acidobacteriota bacterium]
MIGRTRPPGPLLPMIGTLMMPGRDPLAIFTRLARDYGDISYFRMSGERVFFVNNPEYVRQVLVTDGAKFTKSRALERARKLLGDGLLTSDAASHERKRPLVQPAFHRARIAEYGATMVDRAQALSEQWRHGEVIDVSKEMMRLTLAVAARTLFDLDLESKADAVGRALRKVLESFWLTLLPFSDVIEALPLPAVRASQRARAELDALIYEMMAERRADGLGHRRDVLSTLMLGERDSTASALSDQEVRDEVMTLLLAGHETTANALMWTWYLLSGCPDKAAEVYAEVDRVLSGHGPTAADVTSLPYTTKVVTEAMRLFPPAWTIGRRAKTACEIGGYHVPAGSLVFMSQWVMHRDARFYDRPDQFQPERWSQEFKASLPRYAYFPFGGGTRHCIGESFAWMELVLVVATIARRWQLRLLPGHPIVPQPLLTLRAKHGMRMTPLDRRRAFAAPN